jgi:predicted TIM-barrel fold metal-dependent hydrolase
MSSAASPVVASGDHERLLQQIKGHAIDFDNHFYEEDFNFTRYIDPKFRDLAFEPKPQEEFGGKRQWMSGDKPATFVPVGVTDDVAPPGFAAGIFTGKHSVEDWMQTLELLQPSDHPEWNYREPRLRLLDEQGLDTAVIIPSIGVAMGLHFRDRPDVLTANFRAFNRWLEDEWGYDPRSRTPAVPLLALDDLDWAVEELERVVALGARFVHLPHSPVQGKISPADPRFDPFWARMEESGTKVVFHIGYEAFDRLYGSLWGEPSGRNLVTWSPFQHYIAYGERPIADAMAAMILHNLFGRFPGLELITIENGSAWVPGLLRQMDKAAKLGRNGEWIGGRFNDLPSDVFKNHVYVNPFHEEDIEYLIDSLGADRILFGSDYPHPEGIARPLEYAEQIVGRVCEADFFKIMRGNAAKLLGLPQ